mmetsp:Transcript_53176/g.116680  ORF Transcript_53176/g.116680 Transcript_53176/m.116680 type:complete len:201 (+) Transcript_53176:177-779(+)
MGKTSLSLLLEIVLHQAVAGLLELQEIHALLKNVQRCTNHPRVQGDGLGGGVLGGHPRDVEPQEEELLAAAASEEEGPVRVVQAHQEVAPSVLVALETQQLRSAHLGPMGHKIKHTEAYEDHVVVGVQLAEEHVQDCRAESVRDHIQQGPQRGALVKLSRRPPVEGVQHLTTDVAHQKQLPGPECDGECDEGQGHPGVAD